MRKYLSLAVAAILVGLAAAFAVPAFAADDYPSRPVRLIVPAGPGGPNDVPARLAAQILGDRLGQPFVVEHRPGAGGAIGARAVANSPADGYTLLLGNTGTLAVLPAVAKTAGYDPTKDLMPIVRIVEAFQILVVRSDAPWKTAKEFIDYTKANPGKLNFAHSGPGSLPHLSGELFMLRAGVKLTGVPYRSGGESITAVLSGAVQATFESIAILRSQIADGKVRALGAMNKTRSPLLPDMVTMGEAGVPDALANSFYGLAAPAGTPDSVIRKISDAMNAGLNEATVKKTLAISGGTVAANSPAEFASYIVGEYRKWKDVGRAAGVEIQ